MFYVLCVFLQEVDENVLGEDEESEIEIPVSGPAMTAKDGTKWTETPKSEH